MGRPQGSKNKPKVEVHETQMNSQPQSNSEISAERQNFARDYATSLRDDIFKNPVYFNPIWQNQILKDINMNPNGSDRDNAEEMVKNPRGNEAGLRRLSQYLENTVMPLRRLYSYYARMLEWDYQILPQGSIDEDEFVTSKFKNDINACYDWIEGFNPKKMCSEMMSGAIAEDGKFFYLRESSNGFTLQEMPSEWCLITHKNDIGYQYAFNMTYFMRTGINLDDYAPEFRDYYNNFMCLQTSPTKVNLERDGLRVEYKNGTYFYWQELSPEKAFVFKFDPLHAGLTPPLIGLFVDATEVDTYRNLQKTKTKLETYRLVVATLPRHKTVSGQGGGNVKDDFAIQAKTAAQFAQIIKSSLPEGVDFKVTPFESVQAIDFPYAENKADIAGRALKNFLNSSGSSQTLTTNERPNEASVEIGAKIDAAFVSHMYRQMEAFINYQFELATKKYKMVIRFEGTFFDRKERNDRAKLMAEIGVITPLLASSLGYNMRELRNVILLSHAMGFPEILIPVLTSSTQSGKDSEAPTPEGGRPPKKPTGSD